ncbi:hypothetical protein ANRL4_05298 [Anaerolineae bacterium]|nr:hypothetical protein ANRL4_05298 [Anaerolineae bacterium]
MSDLNITAASVVPADTSTTIARGTAGGSITAGQVVYADPADNYRIKPAQATDEDEANNVVGIALNGAYSGQPIAYATSGDVTFNSAFTAASLYVLSGENAGGIAPSADLDDSTNTWYGVVLGIATSATNLRLGITKSGAKNP